MPYVTAAVFALLNSHFELLYAIHVLCCDIVQVRNSLFVLIACGYSTYSARILAMDERDYAYCAFSSQYRRKWLTY